jgi:flavin reductase (DIM6/NTAB) family NADH-FMN oxidoreductase RutF
MHATAAPFSPETSEVEALGLSTVPSVAVLPPRLAVSKVHLECRHFRTLEVEQNHIVIGLVRHLHVADGIVDPETHRILPSTFEGVGRLHGPGWYATTRDRFDLGPFPPVSAAKTPERG